MFINDGSPVPGAASARARSGRRHHHAREAHAGALTDGPWCPDANIPTRFDADLLRIRKVGVRLRAADRQRQPARPGGALFTNGGTSRGGNKYLPDQEVRFEVTPRNLNLGR